MNILGFRRKCDAGLVVWGSSAPGFWGPCAKHRGRERRSHVQVISRSRLKRCVRALFF
jgi:hypothetical protein